MTVERILLPTSPRSALIKYPNDDSRKAAFTEAAYLRRTFNISNYVAWLQDTLQPEESATHYAVAAQFWREALAAVGKELGAEHPDTAASLNNLAILLRAQGDFAGARPLAERAVGICEKHFGAKHAVTAGRLNNFRPPDIA